MKNLLMILVVAMFSCNSMEIETNDQDFNVEYLQPFIEKANSYGVKVNNYPVTIMYVDELPFTGEDIAGYADVENKTIYFNTSHTYWNSEARTVLIYHELAHYYLSKVHIDESVSCDVPFSIMSLWSEDKAPIQFDYWSSGEWYELEDYYIEELFRGSNVWKQYPEHGDIVSHELVAPCWN